MLIRILKPLGGYGRFVQGAPQLFSLCAGDLAEVEESQARKWIASGIAAPAPSAPESAALAPASPAPRPAPRPRPRGAQR